MGYCGGSFITFTSKYFEQKAFATVLSSTREKASFLWTSETQHG